MVAEDNKPVPIEVEDHKTVTIVVEGTPHKWPEEYITYDQVVTLEEPDYAQNPQITYTVIYKRGPRDKPEGTLSKWRHRQGRRGNGVQCYTDWPVITTTSAACSKGATR